MAQLMNLSAELIEMPRVSTPRCQFWIHGVSGNFSRVFCISVYRLWKVIQSGSRHARVWIVEYKSRYQRILIVIWDGKHDIISAHKMLEKISYESNLGLYVVFIRSLFCLFHQTVYKDAILWKFIFVPTSFKVVSLILCSL